MLPLLGGAALVLAFVLLHQRRVRGCVAACALQGWVVALAAAWQGWVQAEPQLCLAAVATLAANGVLLPLALARLAERLALPGDVEPALGVLASMLLGLLLVALAILAVRPAMLGGITLTREDLALALSVTLLGLAVMIGWRSALLQVVGVLSLGNGLILAVVGVPGMPMAGELSVAVLAMGGLAVLGLSFRVQQQRG
jgi:hydrogenase-4 component E